jgi:molybdenum storage protein
VSELKKRKIETLPFDEVLLDILTTTRLVKEFQIINGLKPDLIAAAIRGEHVGSIIHSD